MHTLMHTLSNRRLRGIWGGLALAGTALFVAGCRQTDTVNAAPKTATRDPGAHANGIKIPYAVRTTYEGKSGAAFTVTVNNQLVASPESTSPTSETDISEFLHHGDNQVIVAWTAQSGMSPSAAATIQVGCDRNGVWTPLVYERVTRGNAEGEKSYKIRIAGAQGDVRASVQTGVAPASPSGVASVPPNQAVSTAPPVSDYTTGPIRAKAGSISRSIRPGY